MAKPKIDFKKLLLEKGERYGLIVAVVLMGLLVVWGISSAAGSANTEERASKLTEKAENIRKRIATGPAGTVPGMDSVITDIVDIKRIDANKFANREYFVSEQLASSKRGSPSILAPTEFQADVVRGPIFVYGYPGRRTVVNPDTKQPEEILDTIYVLKEKPKGERQNFDRVGENARRRPGGAAPARPGAGPGGPGAGPGGGPGMPGGGPGLGGGPGMGAPGGGPGFPGGGDRGGAGGQGFNNAVVNELVQVKIEDFLKGNYTPALFIRPMRAVVVSASFPWKKQLEEYRTQLRYNSLSELVSNAADLPQFRGFKVKRRVTTPSGTVGNWEDFKWQDKYYDPIYREKIMEDHQDPADLLPVIPGEEMELFVPLPKLVRGEYAAITMPSIQRTLNTIRNSKEASRIPPSGGKLSGEGNIFKRGGVGTAKKPSGEAPKESQPANDAQEAFLIRFIDVDVQPGYSYEYQVQIRAVNPNYGKKTMVSRPDHAAAEELLSQPVIATFADGSKHTTLVRIPEEQHLFAALEGKDIPKADQVRVQVHNWRESVRIDRMRANSFEPVADWIVEDVFVPRGQFVVATKNVRIPIWSPTKNTFQFMEFGKSTRPGMKGTLPIDLVAPALLVDFDGGQIRQNVTKNRAVTDDGGVEVLFLGEDGKVRARSAWVDAVDPDRTTRESRWLTWQKDTKEAGSSDKPGDDNPFNKPGKN